MNSSVVNSPPQTVVVGCPHCRQALRVESRLGGRQIACPKCRGALVVPIARPAQQETASDIFTQPAMIAAIVGVHLFVGMVLWVMTGIGPTLLLLSLLGTVEIVIWKREPIATAIVTAIEQSRARRRELQEIERARKQAWEKAAETKQTTHRSPAPETKLDRRRSSQEPVGPAGSPDDLLPGSASTATRTRNAEPIPPRPSSAPSRPADPRRPPALPTHSESLPLQKPARNWYGMLGGLHTLGRAGANLPPTQVEFFGMGTTLLLDRGTIVAPLVYATASAQHGSFDASLIDGSLPIAPPQAGRVEGLPYWPTYHDASPQQRSRYLDWLIGGRCDPNIELGYVFIYFYGLERRILVDNADHQAVAEEVLRLRKTYSHSRSFQRYSASLLWMIVALSAKQFFLASNILEQVFATTEHWDDESLDRCLAYLYDSGSRLSADWAYLVAKQDRRIQNSVIIRRHEALFRDLFKKKFDQQFPTGLQLKASKRSRPLTYRPASSTLLQTLASADTSRFGDLPNVLGIESQFKPLIEIWNECIDELRAYDKAHRVDGQLSAAAYEALPPELRQGDHPDFDKWFDLWRECANADGVPIVSLARLAAMKGIAERRTLLKSQCLEMLQTAACIGVGIEPDSRLLGRNYRWGDVVTLFLLDGEESADATAYQGASSLLHLGLIVAAADGTIDPDEVKRITQHLEDQFNLAPGQSRRLEALRFLLQHTRPDPAKVFSLLKKRLSEGQRVLVGEYLIGIAAADQVITPEENQCLQRIFAALGVPNNRLSQLIQPVVAGIAVGANSAGTDGASETSFYLDHQAISRIMRDTDAVASILRTAMAEVDEEEPDDSEPPVRISPAPVDSNTAAAPQLDGRGSGSGTAVAPVPTVSASAMEPPERFRAFYNALVAQAEWSEAEAKELARRHGVMLGGAVEALNEWSQDRWQDWLIEEGDPLRVRLDLLERKTP